LLRVLFRPILAGKEPQLRAWLSELNRRADEVRATFKDETVRAEQAFIITTAGGPVLVYCMEAADFERGAAAYATSQHPIDAEHRAVMRECLGPALDIQPLYNVATS